MPLENDYTLDLSGLDYDILRYMDVQSDAQRVIQGFYLPQFEGCQKVVDLACGDGDFVKLLLDNGIQATGVDFDVKAHDAAEEHGLPIVRDDVFHYLQSLEPDSIDGIFCAHLVEHLPYEKVLELIHLSYRALSDGGVLVVATPDARSLYAHLEMYYRHFGHISFYHPLLLSFFLDHAGFADTEIGANPNTKSPLMPELQRIADAGDGQTASPTISYRPEIAPQGRSLLNRWSYHLKRRLSRWLVQPFLDDLVLSANQEIEILRAEQSAELRALAASVQSLNSPFECFAIGRKRLSVQDRAGTDSSPAA